MKKCIVLANGSPPKKSVFNFLNESGYKTLICADGGANNAFKLKLNPDYIIGDFDSVRSDVLKYYKNKSKIIKYDRQTDTDVEKCLKFAISKKYSEVILTGATGDRLDHTFCNLGIVLKFYKKIKIDIVHEKSVLFAATNILRLKTFPDEIISIYGIDRQTTITSKGLKYPLTNTILPFGEKESTSNSALAEIVELEIKGGIVFVIRDFDALRKHGYFKHS